MLENPPEPGAVRVVVAGAAGALSGPTLAGINAYLDTWRPLCVLVEAVNASETSLAVTGTVRILASHPNSGAALTQATDKLLEIFGDLPIGGTVRLSDLIAAIDDTPGVESVLLSSPATDTPLGATSVAVPTLTLTPVYV